MNWGGLKWQRAEGGSCRKSEGGYNLAMRLVSPPPVLSIAGSDSSAGAGIQADLKTLSALGCYGLTALTSVVSETPGKVSRVQLLEPAMIEDQIRVLLAGFPVAAVKTGMLGGVEQVMAVVGCLRGLVGRVPLVVDPVMVATGGGRLLEEDAVEAVRRELLPLATVITPNMDEAMVLWGGARVETRAEMERCALDLADEYGVAVLLKGGHLRDGTAGDVLACEGKTRWYEGRRVAGVHTHGTGCSYSSAIAAGLTQLPLEAAVEAAKAFIGGAIAQHFRWPSPGGGEVDALNHLAQEGEG
jgi:hydroxymethylpyrimidine/phosphomethylpyrimidine kinase